jgi:hypothetical protein
MGVVLNGMRPEISPDFKILSITATTIPMERKGRRKSAGDVKQA